MRRYIYIFTTLLVLSCNSNNTITGDYKSVSENTIFESLSFDGTVVSFGGLAGNYMPSSKYEVKNNKIYIETVEGILVFKIIDANTIQCETSLLKGELFKR